jgi:hypothetical protein
MSRSRMKLAYSFCAAIALACGIQQCVAQCVTEYSDQSSDGYTLVATDTLIDNFTDPGSGCVPGNWYAFTHSYTTNISLTSPTGRYNSSVAYGSQGSGTSPGYNTASVSLSLYSGSDLDEGDWTIGISENIVCSIGGAFFIYNPFSNINIRLTVTWWQTPAPWNSSYFSFFCSYGATACTSGTPTCNDNNVPAVQVLGTFGCPSTLHEGYIVVGGTCFIGVGTGSNSPTRICN